MEGLQASSTTERAFGQIAGLAAAVARPFDIFDRSDWSLGALSPDEMRTLARDPAFARPIERAVAARLIGSELSLLPRKLVELTTTGEGRLAILMISEPIERVEEAGLLCAAATMQREVLKVTAKADRLRLRQAFGPSAYQVATQEAPMLYAGLAGFGDARRFEQAMAEGLDPGASRRQLADFGLGLLLRIVATAAPGLAALATKRLPPDARPRGLDNERGIDLKQLTKLMQRRMPRWSAIID